ncbi:DegT/DnrJ/EryC1/StrS family aminotransferase [Candidatus Pseudothioglobus singularis]|nr:DegT/DnrJ/EryC1/StrS family aminotransferase [Candidatus Pseudothioglobus singularis]
MKIDFANLQLQYQKYKDEIDTGIHSVLDNSNYIMGEQVSSLENSLEEFASVKHAICCSSGTDALLLSLMSIDIQPGEEVITTPFTFVATAEAIALMKAKPVFVDIDNETFNLDANKIESAITNKTKAIIAVSLYGQPSDIDSIQSIAKKYNLKVIIDGAQSFGSTYDGKSDSSLGDISVTSFFPSKPLGCYGDGGAVFTNNDSYANKIRMLRVHGQVKRYSHKLIGMGARLDTLQASVLKVKLSHYKDEIKKRNSVAQAYDDFLENFVLTPKIKNNRTSVWAQYTVLLKNRNDVQLKLKEKGIPSTVHYPIPLHLQECFADLKYKKGDFPVAEKISQEVLSLPINSFLKDDEIDYIAQKLILILKNN